MMHGVRYRERGPMKSWRPETMAEAIWSVLQEGLSLSQAARKHDIPYPTFVLYANRVHNMLGPSISGGIDTVGSGNINLDLRPKGRGRPQRILLGNWPDEHVRQVIRAVVFRDGTIPSYSHATSSSYHVRNTGSSSSSSNNENYGNSETAPRAPPTTPALGRPLTPVNHPAMSKFLDNNLFAAHLKNLSEHFNKNGGNGFLDPFKALINEDSSTSSKNMDYEDADEEAESRRESMTSPNMMGKVIENHIKQE